MTIECLEIKDRGQWLEMRKHDITGSVIAALFGCHPVKNMTPLRLYVQHRGVEFPPLDEDDPLLRRGRWMEPAIGKAVGEKRPEWQIVPAHEYYRDPDLRLGATPDFYIMGDPRGRGILQTKSVARSVLEREWLGGTVAPFYTILQTLTECLLTDAAFGAAAALLVDAHAMDVWVIEVPRHAGAERKIIDRVRQFWADVAAGNEPGADYERDAETIRAMQPKPVAGKSIDLSANNSIRENLEQRAMLMARIKADETRCTEIENEIKVLMGDAEFVSGLNGWRITFKDTNYQGYEVKPRTVRVLRITDQRDEHEHR